MADSLTGTPPEVATTSNQEVLLATKLHVPGAQPDFVSRPRLADRLDEGLARGVILVSAPAGFGKTSLLAEWTHQSPRSVAWLSLDAGDNDPARFWRHALAALDRVHPGTAERLAPLLGVPASPSFEGLVTALVNELASPPGEDEVVLVLDDYHLIDAQPVHESLTYLLEHLPPVLRLVLSSRGDPPLPLARLRAGRQLTELRADELRFTTGEAAALLRLAIGPDLPDAAAAELARRTEGWVAGLQLAALSLRGRPDVAGLVAAFSGRYRHVLDYFTEEVLERQPPQVRAFLLETSVLERLSGELCDAVTGRADGQAMLEAIERASLFLVPLDEVRGWWRFHQLFADLLRARVEQESAERVRELHRNAAAWHDEQGLADEAVRHALAAGEDAWAARVIERHLDAVHLRGEGATLQRWLAALPAELVRSRPRLLLAQALLALLSGRVEGVEDLLAAAEQTFADVAQDPYEPSVGRVASTLANVPAAIALDRAHLAELRGDAEHAIAFGRRALAETSENESMLHSIARARLAVAEWLCGRPVEAERALSSVIEEWRAAGERYLAVRGCHYLALIRRAQGRLDAALATDRQAIEVAAAPGGPTMPAAGAAYVGMAEVDYQRGELDAALQHVTEGLALCRQLPYPQPLATGLATLAWIRHANGDDTGALAAMDEAGRVASGLSVCGLMNPVPVQRARLLLAHGDAAASVAWTTEQGVGVGDEPTYPREPDYLLLARVLLAQRQPDQALRLLERLLAIAATHGRLCSVIEVQALRALASASAGDEAGSVDALAEAVALAWPHGYVRVFADEGTPMGDLLRRLVASRRGQRDRPGEVPLRYLGRLVRALEREAPDGAAGPSPGGALVSPVARLSERELQVLRLLAAGKQNQEIARELYLALDTVKKHVTHIFEKLGAANRTEAAARARELGLLP